MRGECVAHLLYVLVVLCVQRNGAIGASLDGDDRRSKSGYRVQCVIYGPKGFLKERTGAASIHHRRLFAHTSSAEWLYRSVMFLSDASP